MKVDGDRLGSSLAAAPCKIILLLILQHRRLRQLGHRLRSTWLLLLLLLRARSTRSRGLSAGRTASDPPPTSAPRRRDRSVRVRTGESGRVVQREVLLCRHGALESRADGDAALSAALVADGFGCELAVERVGVFFDWREGGLRGPSPRADSVVAVVVAFILAAVSAARLILFAGARRRCLGLRFWRCAFD